MTRTQRRLLLLVAALPLLVVGFAVLYMVGMAYLEGEERSFWAALEWAAETLSTTGYGHDDFWRHPAMVLLVALAQFIGVFLVFPIYLIPFLEERFEKRAPRQAPGGIADHVLVFRSGPAVETLLTQLAQRRIPALVVETDEAAARRWSPWSGREGCWSNSAPSFGSGPPTFSTSAAATARSGASGRPF